ncbi:hypothetical protein GLOIN_2v1779084 [Rhizophagus clarus]|uniref:BTB domain-containing protein n=1 Tax=Rhizophagus clarus TaxID=94130 RepID=A0A8H3LPR5_9GLOM|nr:hypothetical protein GLOIN_2v1779084 [Rhizophagus clarus]
MIKQFFPNLSQNFVEILDDNEYYDITIEVGEDPNVKIFRAHMIILYYRFPFLRRTLSSNKKNDNGVLAHIKLSDISPEIFQIILRYIYGGIISLNEQEPSEILRILVAADKLHLQELIDYLQKYLIENKSEWMEQYFELIYQTSFQSNSLLELQEFCTNFMAKSPEKVFKSLDFTLISEKSLVSLIKRDDLKMKEIEVWENLLKWGLEKHPTLLLDPTTWSDDDFKMMKNTLQDCIPLVRFFSLSSDEFIQKVRPYKKLLNRQLYEELLNSYLNSDSEPSDNILLPRYRYSDDIIDSKIVNLNIASLISRWIDKIDIKKTEEIIGGYNPLIWESNKDRKWGQTKDSFIFSFKSKNNFKVPILSHVKNIDYAVCYHILSGPTFSDDICIYMNRLNSIDSSKAYNCCKCKQYSYDKRIRDTVNPFLIEDYEVFQIIKKK